MRCAQLLRVLTPVCGWVYCVVLSSAGFALVAEGCRQGHKMGLPFLGVEVGLFGSSRSALSTLGMESQCSAAGGP